MGWTSSTAVIGIGIDGATGTTSNNALIVGYGSGDFLEVAGANDTVIGSYGNDSLGAIMYPALGMNGNYAYIDGSAGDVFIALAMQDEQHATLVGGAGEGADFIAGADAFDTVNLYNMNLSDIAAVTAEAGTITLAQDATARSNA